MPPPKDKPFRQAVFLMAVRTRLITRLVRSGDYTRAEARAAVDDLDVDIIEAAALTVETNPTAPPGGWLAFILQFIQSEKFAQIIELLLSLFGIGSLVAALPPPAAATAEGTAPGTAPASAPPQP